MGEGGNGTETQETRDSTGVVTFFYLLCCENFRVGLDPEESQAMMEAAQRGCAISIFGGIFQNLTE